LGGTSLDRLVRVTMDDYIARIAAAQDVDALDEAFTQVVRALGLRWFSYRRISLDDSDRRHLYLRSQLPSVWLQR